MLPPQRPTRRAPNYSIEDYPEHLNPFRDDEPQDVVVAPTDAEEPELRPTLNKFGTWTVPRRRSHLNFETWSSTAYPSATLRSSRDEYTSDRTSSPTSQPTGPGTVAAPPPRPPVPVRPRKKRRAPPPPPIARQRSTLSSAVSLPQLSNVGHLPSHLPQSTSQVSLRSDDESLEPVRSRTTSPEPSPPSRGHSPAAQSNPTADRLAPLEDRPGREGDASPEGSVEPEAAAPELAREGSPEPERSPPEEDRQESSPLQEDPPPPQTVREDSTEPREAEPSPEPTAPQETPESDPEDRTELEPAAPNALHECSPDPERIPPQAAQEPQPVPSHVGEEPPSSPSSRRAGDSGSGVASREHSPEGAGQVTPQSSRGHSQTPEPAPRNRSPSPVPSTRAPSPGKPAARVNGATRSAPVQV